MSRHVVVETQQKTTNKGWRRVRWNRQHTAARRRKMGVIVRDGEAFTTIWLKYHHRPELVERRRLDTVSSLCYLPEAISVGMWRYMESNLSDWKMTFHTVVLFVMFHAFTDLQLLHHLPSLVLLGAHLYLQICWLHLLPLTFPPCPPPTEELLYVVNGNMTSTQLSSRLQLQQHLGTQSSPSSLQLPLTTTSWMYRLVFGRWSALSRIRMCSDIPTYWWTSGSDLVASSAGKHNKSLQRRKWKHLEGKTSLTISM